MTASYDRINEASAQKAGQANKLFDAAWPAMTLGLRSATGLTLNLFGGRWNVGGEPTLIDDQALLLDDASTCYVYIEDDGTVDFDTSAPSGWPGPVSGKTALWQVTTASGAITATTDLRVMGGGSGGGGSFTGGTLTTALNEAPITTLASASTTDIGAEDVNTISISGTTTITAFDTIASGAVRRLVFQGALTLTHNGTSLILPTAANITTAAGDVATFVSLGSGNWRCVGYLRASGYALRVPFRDTYAISDETTDITTGTAKLTVPWPYANSTLTAVYASLVAASSSGAPQFDINEAGSSILSTKLTIDASETDSSTAATPAVISDASIAHRAAVTFDIDTAGTGAKGAKITVVGYYIP